MRMFSILAVIAATATPVFAANDAQDRAEQAKTITSAQVERAGFFTAGTSATVQEVAINILGDRNR